MNFYQRLEIIRKEKDLTKKAFSEALGIKDSYYTKLKDIASPSISLIEKLKNYDENLSLDWLVMGKGDPYLSNTSSSGAKGEPLARFYNQFSDEVGYALVLNEYIPVTDDRIAKVINTVDYLSDYVVGRWENNIYRLNYDSKNVLEFLTFDDNRDDKQFIADNINNANRHFALIIKNDLLTKGYPLLDSDKYLGGIWRIEKQSKDKYIITPYNKDLYRDFDPFDDKECERLRHIVGNFERAFSRKDENSSNYTPSKYINLNFDGYTIQDFRIVDKRYRDLTDHLTNLQTFSLTLNCDELLALDTILIAPREGSIDTTLQ